MYWVNCVTNLSPLLPRSGAPHYTHFPTLLTELRLYYAFNTEKIRQRWGTTNYVKMLTGTLVLTTANYWLTKTNPTYHALSHSLEFSSKDKKNFFSYSTLKVPRITCPKGIVPYATHIV